MRSCFFRRRASLPAVMRFLINDNLFPRPVFRAACDALCEVRGERADIEYEYVRILHLAASTLEETVARALEQLLAAGEAFDCATVRALGAR